LRELLALPEFAALQPFLIHTKVNPDQLQAQHDQLVNQVRRSLESP
jgi:hypothetical protein